MVTAPQGRLGEILRFVSTSAPHTTVAVPVTIMAANKTRSNNGSFFHIPAATYFQARDT